MKFSTAAVWLSLALPTAATAAGECVINADGSTTGECAQSYPECHVYMAPSTLGQDTNMGIYTGKALKDGEVVNYPEIAIPLLFREWGEHRPGYDDGQLWDRYIWEGPVMDIETYDETDLEKSKAVFVPGVGCTVNSILDMNNIESTHGSKYDTAQLKRTKDPGAGAFCPYHSAITNAVTDIPPGAELFAQYGDFWIPFIPGAQITMDAILEQSDDFLMDEYLPFIEENADELSEEVRQGLWEFTTQTEFPYNSKIFSNLPKNRPWREVEQVISQVKAKRAALEARKTASLLKKSEEEAIHKTELDKSSPVRTMIREQSVRTIEWLNTYGYCQDHIKPDISTIPQAGRGAFATRFLPAGTVVGYSPLIHIGIYGREILDIEYQGTLKGNGKPSVHHQYDLVINYSFGHRNSSVLLTPYGGMVNYINHASAGRTPNVAIRWPSRELIAHKPDWLHKDPTFLRDTVEKIGLSFEYVALRDIKEGEEVLMDYGKEWEDAWNQHVLNWEPVANAEDYVHSTEWKEPYLRTEAELKKNPYPSNLHTMCLESFTSISEDADPGAHVYEWLPPIKTSTARVPCRVLERVPTAPDGKYLYTVEMEINVSDSEDDEDEEKMTIRVKDVPGKEGVFLYDKVFTADWHLPNAFRHEILIPDDIMPISWQNGPSKRPW